MTTSAASAPHAFAWRVRLIASSVEFEPVPATTGTRPLVTSTHISVTRWCSGWLSVGDSPVVPQGTRPCVPSEICHSTKSPNARSSTSPPSKGVISAT